MNMSRMACSMVCALLLAGCASDALRIAQLETGMTRAEVEEAQGVPDKVETSGNYSALRYGKQYHVILENDRVIAFGEGRLAKYPGTDRYFINQSDP